MAVTAGKEKKKSKSKGNGNSRALCIGVGSVFRRKTDPTPSCFPIHLFHAKRGKPTVTGKLSGVGWCG
ncbi:hypothetical protein, partial [Stenotrophomonas maltophilia]